MSILIEMCIFGSMGRCSIHALMVPRCRILIQIIFLSVLSVNTLEIFCSPLILCGTKKSVIFTIATWACGRKYHTFCLISLTYIIRFARFSIIPICTFHFDFQVQLTAWNVPAACGGVTGFILIYSFVGSKIKKADKPYYIYIISWGFALLDVTSDYNMAVELYTVDDPLWPLVAAFIILSSVVGSIYFSQ